MIKVKGYAAHNPSQELCPYAFERKEVGVHEVLIRILYCGICHADIHQARNEYGNTMYPLVPGHEIVGRIERVGPQVAKFRNGDLVGVGYFMDLLYGSVFVSVKCNKEKRANQLSLRFYARKLINPDLKNEPPTGFEPATYALRMRRSTS